MEDNTGTIAAICIDDKTNDKKLRGITEGNKYKIKQSPNYTNYYEIINDLGESDAFFKTRFKIIDQQILLDGGIVNYYKDGDFEFKVEGEKVEDKIIKVKCIEKCKEDPKALIINKEYPVLEESEEEYLILNDKDSNDTWYSKELFEKVERTQDKENRCYNEECQHIKDNQCYILKTTSCPICLKEQLNYKEEYKKLKEELQLADFNVGKYIKENSDLKEFKNKYKRMENQFNNNSKVLEDYSTKITILEADNKEYKKANEGLAAESKERAATIKKLQRLIDDNTENAILSNKVEDLENKIKEKEDHIRNLNSIIDRKDKEINVLSTQITTLEEDIKELKRLHENQRLNIKSEMSENRELKAKVVELERVIGDKDLDINDLYKQIYEKEEILQKYYADAKINNNKGYMEQMNITLNEKSEEIERLKNYCKKAASNEIETLKERDMEKDLNGILKDKVEALKESVISLTELI